jgi:hypothetical protein
VCFLENDPRSDDFAVFGVRDRDYGCLSDCRGGSEDVLDLDRKEVLCCDGINGEQLLGKVII